MDIHNIALNETLLENELVILNNNEKTLLFKKENVLIEMTELQRRFMLCLLSGIYKKNDIIRAVWFCNHETISDNNYYQMILQKMAGIVDRAAVYRPHVRQYLLLFTVAMMFVIDKAQRQKR